MSDTLVNRVLEPNVWVDLYAETGLPVGTKLVIQNIGSTEVYLHSGAAEPAEGDGFVIMGTYEFFANKQGDAGAWARSVTTRSPGYINVSEG